MFSPLNFARHWLLSAIILLASYSTHADDLQWPQEVTAPEGTIVVYQPQPESLKGNVLTGRAAVALELTGSTEQIFGAMWFEARLDTDRSRGIALVRDFKVTKVGWPDSKDASEQRFTAIIEGAIPEHGFEISLDQLSSSLATAEVEQQSLEALNNEPPKIDFSNDLAILLLFDGEPRFSAVDNSPYERALNTPFVVVRDTRKGTLWMGDGSFWYKASDPLGPWQADPQPPADLVKMIDAKTEPASGTAPRVVVATKPTELVCSDGDPSWQTLAGGDLLYVQNTETPWLRQLSTGNMYLQLSGRWFRSKDQKGPWTFVRPDELPASFKEIPPASDIGGLRSSVAGTPEAEDAMLDASIPQTAAIKRDEASLAVEYDGKPKFEKIKGTSVSYAVNTGAQVLEIDGAYYAVDEGVWFTSKSAEGPWAVADSVPQEEISKIPPSSPVYNTTYVQIYESTPEIVYVGYRPGYLWSFPYYGVPVYGTGWYYPPYYGRHYYPRPPTWGLHVGYNPWSGWNYGVSWSNGFFSVGMSWGGGYNGPYRPWGCCGGWYGGGYRGPTIINTGDINIGNNINVGNQQNVANRIANNKGKFSGKLDGTNLYDRPANRARLADKSTAARQLKQARPTTRLPNDVYADRNGAVARRDGDAWEQRVDGNWKSTEAASQAKDKVAAKQPSQARVNQAKQRESQAKQRPQMDTRDLNRAHAARSQGARREMSRPMSRPTGGRGRR